MANVRGTAGSGALGGSEANDNKRRQKAGFTIFLDQVADDEGGQHWETRLYHAESGEETTLPGVSPEQWIAWLLERVEPTGTGGRSPPAGPAQALVEVASVEVLDVSVDRESGKRESLHTIRAQVVIQLSGFAGVERTIGSEVLRSIASSDRSTSDRPRPGRG